MMVCPSCHNPNPVGAVFCSDCGVPLEAADAMGTRDFVKATGSRDMLANAGPGKATDNWVTLHLLETGQVLPLAQHSQFTLGRISEGQPIVPDIDLTPYQAYASGVSRLHAVISRGIDRISVTDLGSANGTFVNGRRLDPNAEQPLANGDVVALGRLKIQILFTA